MGVWLVGWEEKNMVGLGVFSPVHQNIFFLKWRENLEEKPQCIKKTRVPMCKCTWVFVSIASFFSLLIFIPVCCTVILLLSFSFFFGYQKISSSLFNFAIFFLFSFLFSSSTGTYTFFLLKNVLLFLFYLMET